MLVVEANCAGQAFKNCDQVAPVVPAASAACHCAPHCFITSWVSAAVEVVKAGGGGAGCCHGRWSHPDTCFSYNPMVEKPIIMLAVECNCLNVEPKSVQKNL